MNIGGRLFTPEQQAIAEGRTLSASLARFTGRGWLRVTLFLSLLSYGVWGAFRAGIVWSAYLDQRDQQAYHLGVNKAYTELFGVSKDSIARAICKSRAGGVR